MSHTFVLGEEGWGWSPDSGVILSRVLCPLAAPTAEINQFPTCGFWCYVMLFLFLPVLCYMHIPRSTALVE